MEPLLFLCFIVAGSVLSADGQGVPHTPNYQQGLLNQGQIRYPEDIDSRQISPQVGPTTLLHPINGQYPSQYPYYNPYLGQSPISDPSVAERSKFSPDVPQRTTSRPGVAPANIYNDKSGVKDVNIGQQPVKPDLLNQKLDDGYRPLPFHLRPKIEFDATTIALTDFSLNLMRKAVIQRQGNLIVSPYSVATLVALVQQGATGEALTQISDALQLGPLESAAAYKNLTRDLQIRNSRNILRSANNIFLSNTFDLNSKFRTVAQRNFDSDVTTMSFDNAELAAKNINDWVSSKTEQKIPKILSPESIAANTQIVLVNAIYFKGLWQIPFRASATKSDTFYLSDNTRKNVLFMNSRRNIRAGVDPETDSTVISLPFEREEYSLMLIRPSTLSNAHDTYGLLTRSRLESYLNMRPIEVQMSIPKFTIRADTNLTPVLTQLGITKIFEQNSGLTNLGRYDTYTPQVSSAVHSAVLSIDEEGGSAAGATAFAVVALSNDDASLFLKLDRPFVAILWDLKAVVPLFMAVIEDPVS